MYRQIDLAQVIQSSTFDLADFTVVTTDAGEYVSLSIEAMDDAHVIDIEVHVTRERAEALGLL